MNDAERDQWLSSIGDIESADELLKHHATLEEYLGTLTAQAKNVRRVVKMLETLAAEEALSDKQRDASFDHGTVKLEEKQIFNVIDWDKYYAWIAENPIDRMTGYLHKREGSTAIGKHLAEHGELPPGCEERVVTEVKVKSQQLQLDPDL